MRKWHPKSNLAIEANLSYTEKEHWTLLTIDPIMMEEANIQWLRSYKRPEVSNGRFSTPEVNYCNVKIGKCIIHLGMRHSIPTSKADGRVNSRTGTWSQPRTHALFFSRGAPYQRHLVN